ncbi:hypothetical protein A3F66_03135 [candidate division TM6 bacterium RIFCSPHIGHO2_12_FULL_32_22]|nr:MAG: hypothetical protein A3F66_03135 [candidate division TM6 bacterium RIFCSPHIGHO2_12_FULL_32_22]
MKKSSLFPLFLCNYIISFEAQLNLPINHDMRSRYQTLPEDSQASQISSLRSLWQAEQESLHTLNLSRNRARLWSKGYLKDSDLKPGDIACSNYYELLDLISREYPVSDWVKTGTGWALIGAVCTIFVAGTETDITTLIQIPSVVNQAAFGGTYGGGALSILSWGNALKNFVIRRRKINKLVEELEKNRAGDAV